MTRSEHSSQLATMPRVEDGSAEVAQEPVKHIPAGVWMRHLESRLTRAEDRNAQWAQWFERLRTSPLFRLLSAVGLWRWREDEGVELQQTSTIEWHHFPPPRSVARLEFPASNRPSGEGAVAIDLSTLLPGAENGGAKAVALAVVEELARMHPQEHFLVLVDEATLPELSGLQRDNVELVEMPPRVDRTFERLVDSRGVKVILCPMTLPRWTDPRVPLVSVVHDLQHRFLPWFFDDAEKNRRERALEHVALTADEVISVSKSTRRHLSGRGGAWPISVSEKPVQAWASSQRQLRSGIERVEIPADRVTVIHNRIAGRLPELDDEEVNSELETLGLEADGFVLYPANFWSHKNHQALVHGFSQFCRAEGASDLQLVMTGAKRPDPAPLLEAIRRLGLKRRARYLGFVEERQLSALYRGGRALIFPSLFEGFGMPLVEAMGYGLPVFASRLDVHQEVAGDAAELFDPRSASAIRDAFETIDSNRERLDELRALGPEQAKRLGDTRAMGEEYWRVLERAAGKAHSSVEFQGYYPDGWTTERFLITHMAPCELLLEVCNPRQESVTLRLEGGGQVEETVVLPEKSARLRCKLRGNGGWIEGRVSPSLTPDGDIRSLGLMMRHCFLCIEDGLVLDLLAEES